MYHILYKITNKNNGMFYIGCHSTSNLNDGYMGSGVLISKAIEYYGLKNFKKEILKYCKTRQAMFVEERKIVNKSIVKNPQSYNLITGGKRKSKNTFKIKAKTKNCKELLYGNS